MKRTRILLVAVAGAIWLGEPPAWADSLCPDQARQADAAARLKQAEDLERAGKAREAYRAAEKVDGECVTDYKRQDALKTRAAKAIGAQDEKNGNFKDAFDWYVRAQSFTDAGRMQRKLVEAQPNDIATVARAIEYFVRQQDGAQERALRAQALKNLDKALMEEEQRFASVTKDSLNELRMARDWSYYAEAGEDRIRARAAQRGDSLAAENGRKFLNLAIDYYQAAGRPEKAGKVRDKARTLAGHHESKGEGEMAAEYYVIAGDDKKAEAVQQQTDARRRQDEESRKKEFKKEQTDLEKALGF